MRQTAQSQRETTSILFIYDEITLQQYKLELVSTTDSI